MTIKVAFLGAGRMGRAAAKEVAKADGMQVAAAFDVSGSDPVEGVEVSDISELAGVLKEQDVDVVVDFSSAEACVENSKTVGEYGADMVVGTTGFTKEQEEELKKNLEGVGLVLAPNMSVGVNVFWKLVAEAARNFKDYDIEVVEAHHRFKKDAPSGTALKTVEAIAEAVGADTEEDVIYGRHGQAQRRDGEICVHSIRAGDIVGEHTVIYSNLGERFEVKHTAHRRESFASGIPAAVKYVKSKRGVYDMQDVLGLK